MRKRCLVVKNKRGGFTNQKYKMIGIVRHYGPEDDDDDTTESSDDPWFTDVTLFEE